MRIISRIKLDNFIKSYPDSKPPLDRWYKILKTASFNSPAELIKLFPSADQVENFVVFNIGGNNFRLIACIHYVPQILYIRYIMTHTEYDKNKWKNDEWFDKK